MEFWERVKWDVRRIWHQARKVVLRRRIGERWDDAGDFRSRRYPDYETYLEHQKTKFSALRSSSIERHDRRFFPALVARLSGLPIEIRGRSVLCLAARQGTEVRAFIEQGAFAVGIDLNPGPMNRHVMVGDFHDLQFADGSIDLVFTNSLDRRFIRPGGRTRTVTCCVRLLEGGGCAPRSDHPSQVRGRDAAVIRCAVARRAGGAPSRGPDRRRNGACIDI